MRGAEAPDDEVVGVALVWRDDVMILLLGGPARDDPLRAVERQHQASTQLTTSSWIARKRLRRREAIASILARASRKTWSMIARSPH